MIDQTVVSDLRDDYKIEVKQALATLAITGVILSQIQLENGRLLNGSSEEDDALLAARIKNHRLHVAYLQELHDLGLKYEEELKP